MADVELLPCPFCGSPAEIDKGGFGEVFAACSKCWCHMGGVWSTTESDAIAAWNRRANVAAATAAPRAEIERLRAEVREAREFRDKMANAIGNEQLRMFIEKHGEPVPLTLRVQAAEARAERLEKALRLAEEHINALTPEWYSAGQRVLAEIRAALVEEESSND